MPESEKERMKKLLLGFITDRKACLSQITKNLMQITVVKRGLDKMQADVANALVDEGKTVDPIKMLNALVKSVRELANSAQINGIIALLHVWEGDFDKEAALALNTLGMGPEALRAFYQSKRKRGG